MDDLIASPTMAAGGIIEHPAAGSRTSSARMTISDPFQQMQRIVII